MPLSCRITVLPSGVLQIQGVQRGDAGNYRCIATNIASRRRSIEAALTVTPGVTPGWRRVSASACEKRWMRSFALKPVSLSSFSSQASASPAAAHHRWAAEHLGILASERHPGVHGHRQPQTHRLLEPSRRQVDRCLQHQSVGKWQSHHHGHQAPARRSLFVPGHHSWHAKLYRGLGERHRVR